MKVPKLSLCKELYRYVQVKDADNIWVILSNNTLLWKNDHQLRINGESVIPAPSLGYLMSKLSEASSSYNLKLYYSVALKVWRCSFEGYSPGKDGDTAEDAACKLYIHVLKSLNAKGGLRFELWKGKL